MEMPAVREMVPGNFEMCWQCFSDKNGEQPPMPNSYYRKLTAIVRKPRFPLRLPKRLKLLKSSNLKLTMSPEV